MAKKIQIGILILIMSFCFVYMLGAQSSTEIEILSDNDSENIETSICVGIDGIVSWWPGDGNTFDNIDENHGTMENGATFASGKVDQAFSFDGVDDYVIANGKNIDDLQQLTVEMWVRINSIMSGIVMERFITLNNEKATLRLTGGNGNLGDLQFYMTIDDNMHEITASVLQAGVFHHIAGTYDGNVMRLYSDGVEVGNLTISGTVATSNAIALGSTPDSTEHLDGLVDEVSIYDRALTPSEINAIYTADNSGKCKPPDSITITSPTASTSWSPDTSYYITWTAKGSISQVNIEIFRGSTVEYSFEQTSNDGSYLWDVPDNIESGTDWRIRISNSFDSSVYDETNNFEIMITIPPYLPLMIIGLPIGFITLILIIKRKSLMRRRGESKKRKKLKREEREKTKIKNKYPVIEQLIQEKNYSKALKELESIVKQAEFNKFRDVLDWAHKKIFISGTLDKLYTLFKTSQSVNIYDLIVALDTEGSETFKKLGDWSKIFQFTGSEGFIAIKKEDIEAFMMIMEKSYDELVEKEKKKKILVFISYSLKDSELFQIREIAQKISFYDEIEEVLYCEEHTKDNFIAYMDEYVGKCDIMILFCSPNALTSVFVKDEWMAGRAMQKPIIPVFTSTNDIPPLLRARVGVEYNALDLQKIINQLYELIIKKTQTG